MNIKQEYYILRSFSIFLVLKPSLHSTKIIENGILSLANQVEANLTDVISHLFFERDSWRGGNVVLL